MRSKASIQINVGETILPLTEGSLKPHIWFDRIIETQINFSTKWNVMKLSLYVLSVKILL
jgi:hypothetical protein